MKSLKLIFISAAILIVVQDAQAALSIAFDTAAETFSFGGAETNGAGESHAWGGAGTDPNGAISATASVDNDGGTVTVTVYTDNLTVFMPTVFGALSGNGTSVSYSGFHADVKAYILTIDGNTYTGLDLGDGVLGDISVTVVPESSQYAAFCGVALLGFVVFRRHSIKRRQEAV
jgi:hypothetical protein